MCMQVRDGAHPMAAEVSRQQHPTFYLGSDATSPVWASASAANSLTVKQRIDELNAAQLQAAREREAQTSPRPDARVHSPTGMERALSGASSAGLDALPAPKQKPARGLDVGRAARAGARRSQDLPPPISVPAPQPSARPGGFADAPGSNSESSSRFASPSAMSDSSDFQDAHSEGAAPLALP